MRVQRLTVADYDRVIALWRSAGLETIRPSGRDAPEAFAREIENDRAIVLGAEAEDGTLIGVVLATHDGRKGWINRLSVEPGRRRGGLGRKLVEAAELALEAEGISVIAALVEGHNDGSLAFFRPPATRSTLKCATSASVRHPTPDAALAPPVSQSPAPSPLWPRSCSEIVSHVVQLSTPRG